MDSSTILVVIVGILIIIGIWFLIRELLNWYWKINLRIALLEKISQQLEKISFQLGASNVSEVTIEEIGTGKRKTITLNEWIDFQYKNPQDKRYKIIGK